MLAGVGQAKLARLVTAFTPTGRRLSFMPKAMMPGTAKEGRVCGGEKGEMGRDTHRCGVECSGGGVEKL